MIPIIDKALAVIEQLTMLWRETPERRERITELRRKQNLVNACEIAEDTFRWFDREVFPFVEKHMKLTDVHDQRKWKLMMIDYQKRANHFFKEE